MAIKKRKKYYVSVRLLPSLILTLASLAYSFSYLDNNYATLFNYLQAAGYFGFSAMFLLIDVGIEVFYKSKSKTYGIFSIAISVAEGIYFFASILEYFNQLDKSSNSGDRLFPLLLLIVLLAINIIYRILTFFGIWKTDDSQSDDLYAAYIGFLGLGTALLNSFPFANILINAKELQYSYVGIFADIALGIGILEALVGVLWLSWKKIRSISKSNIFFYLTLLSLLCSVAGIVVTVFAQQYRVIDASISTWNYAFYGVSTALLLSGSFYLNWMLRD